MPHIQSKLWPKIKKGIDQHIAKWQIGMRRLPFDLIPRTLPGVLKMLETGHRARSYADGELRDSRVPVPHPDLLRHTVDGVFAQDEARVQYGSDAISINVHRCIDEVKEDNKQLRKELAMLRTVIRSDDRMSQLLTQLELQHEVDGDSESGGGGDDEPGMDEDADGDEES
ncbi:hypothetical protein Tco_1476814 [Tanacetum coccineum]